MVKKLAFPGLTPEDFQHPSDKKALEALKKVKGFDFFTKKVLELGLEKIIKVQFTADCLRVSENQCPTLYKIYLECNEVLDIDNPPELYILCDPYLNAFTTGFTHPVVVVSSGLLDAFDDDELRFVLGHELGHYKCGHVLYLTMAQYLSTLLTMVGEMTLGIGRLLGSGLQMALLAWSRRAEFSADRAGLLAAQSENVAMRALMKLAAPTRKIWNEVRIEEILRQAEEFEELSEDKLSKIYKFYFGIQRTHPWLVIRTREIKLWAETDEYEEILEGGVPIEELGKRKISKRKKIRRFCPKCGAEVSPDDNFCSECGYRLH